MHASLDSLETEIVMQMDAPDGGWGWIVVFGGMMCNLVVDGICFSYGIFLVKFIDEFGGSTSKTALAGSLCTGAYLIMGPASSALACRYGYRVVTMIGALVSTAGFLLAIMSANLNMLIFSWGIVAGSGFGLVYLPSIIVASTWFQSKRAFATGVIVSGSGIGAAVISKLTMFLFTMYEWKGVTLILAGLNLNVLVMGALFRPVEMYKEAQRRRAKRPSPAFRRTVDAGVTYESHGNFSDLIREDYSIPPPPPPPAQPSTPRSPSILREPGGGGGARPEVFEGGGGGNSVWIREPEIQFAEYHDEKEDSPTYAGAGGQDSIWVRAPEIQFSEELEYSNYLQPPPMTSHHHSGRLREDMFFSSNVKLDSFAISVRSLSQYRSRHSVFPSESALRYRSTTLKEQDEDIYEDIDANKAEDSEKTSCLEAMKILLDFSLLKRGSFSCFVLATCATMFGLFIPFVYIADFATKEVNLSLNEGSTLILILGMSNTGGRLIAGFVSDYPSVDPLFLNNVALIIGGGATMAVPWLDNFYFLAAYVFVFGISIATFVCLRSIILDNLFGLKYLNNSFGIMLLFHGLATMAGTPCAGMLFDYFGNYTYTFMASGLMLASSGAVCLPLRLLVEYEDKRAVVSQSTASVNKRILVIPSYETAL